MLLFSPKSSLRNNTCHGCLLNGEFVSSGKNDVYNVGGVETRERYAVAGHTKDTEFAPFGAGSGIGSKLVVIAECQGHPATAARGADPGAL